MCEILGMSSGIDDRPSLLNNQVTTYFVYYKNIHLALVTSISIISHSNEWLNKASGNFVDFNTETQPV